jgi:hypothetical protein
MWTRHLSELTMVLAVGLCATRASATPPSVPAANDDPFAEYRERFKEGMDRYKAGAFTEAVGYWEPIYGELGEQKGYRLAYNLGVAYQALGDATRAAEHLEAFLAQVDAKRSQGEPPPAIVEKEENDAKERLATLTAAKGRIHVDPGTPPRAVQVDAMAPRLATFVAWVNPGQHTVTFAPGTATAESKSLEVHAGELLEVAPTPAPATEAPSAPPNTPPPNAQPQLAPAPVSTQSPVHLQATHPFPAALLFVGGGLTLAAGIASVPLETNAWSLYNKYAKESPILAGDSASFNTARTWAYGMIATTVALGVITAGLVTWYFAGAREESGDSAGTARSQVFLTPGGVTGRF